jgi:hypothetical protein
MKIEKQRTNQQNKALHKWCDELARECSHKGVSYKAVVQNMEVDWTPEAVKGIIRAVLKAMYKKDSTADATTVELTNACKEVDKIFLEQGILIGFPSLEEDEFIKHYTNI